MKGADQNHGKFSHSLIFPLFDVDLWLKDGFYKLSIKSKT